MKTIRQTQTIRAMKGQRLLIGVLLLGLLLAPAAGLVMAQGPGPQGDDTPQDSVSSAFTYQGRLKNASGLVNNTCDFRFSLWDALSGGTQQGTTQTKTNVTVSEGLFTVELDFGSSAFTGDTRWLQIAVRCSAGSGTYTTLSPRQPLTAAPYALSLRPGANIRNQATSGLTSGIYLASIFGDGVTVYEAGDDGVCVAFASKNGVSVDQVGGDGVRVIMAGNASTMLSPSSTNNGFEVANAEGYGLYVGRADSSGVYVNSAGWDGVAVSSAPNASGVYVGAAKYGVYVSQTSNDGVYVNEAGNPSTTNASGLYNGFEVAGAQGVGLYVGRADGSGVFVQSAGSYAGYFNGTGYFAGALTKAGGGFKIDHPQDPANKYLYHSYVESPDMMNVYNGNVTLDANGEAWVELPEWFEVLNRDFRYQLTCIGGFAPVYIARKIQDNRFQIAGGTLGLEVSWQVTGIRRDPWAEANRLPVEEDKPPEERGTYLHPAIYGQPETRGLAYKEAQVREGR